MLFALVACTTVEHTELLTATNALPEIDAECVPTTDDIALEDGTRVVSRVGPDGDSCRAEVYARTAFLDWADIEAELSGPSPLGALSVEWVTAKGEFAAIAVETSSGATAPAGTSVVVAQLLSTDSEGQPAFDEDPTALLDGLATDGLTGYPEHLLGFDYVLAGGETDLVDLVSLVQSSGAASIVDASWQQYDPVVYLLTVASVAVPLETLATLGATELSLAVEESVTIEAEVGYKLFGSDEF